MHSHSLLFLPAQIFFLSLHTCVHIHFFERDEQQVNHSQLFFFLLSPSVSLLSRILIFPSLSVVCSRRCVFVLVFRPCRTLFFVLFVCFAHSSLLYVLSQHLMRLVLQIFSLPLSKQRENHHNSSNNKQNTPCPKVDRLNYPPLQLPFNSTSPTTPSYHSPNTP